jgi:hypothetical protein
VGLAIVGGASATAITFFLLTLGSGLGLMLVKPLSSATPSVSGFLTGGAIYFFVAQAFGFAVGGHLAGRLLGPIVETDTQETFRAVAHGLLAWCVAVLSTLAMLGLVGASAAGSGATIAALYTFQAPRATPLGRVRTWLMCCSALRSAPPTEWLATSRSLTMRGGSRAHSRARAVATSADAKG